MTQKKDIVIKGSSILVTGGAGFIGSALVRKLEALKCDVTIIDSLVAGRQDHLDGCKARLVEGDIRNKELLKEIMKRDSPSLCYHLAAEPFIPKGYQNPEIMFDVNTMGTISVLKACQAGKVQRMIYYSTSEVYGSAKTLPMSESHPTLPQSMYALAKFAGDRACFILWKERNIPVVILRQFNCFTADTQVATPEGLKLIKELKKGNKIYTMNPQTNEIEEDIVEETIKTKSKKLISFSHKSLNFIVTPEHRFFLRSHGRKDFHWYLAKDLVFSHNDYRFPVHSEKPDGEEYNSKMLELIAWYVTEGYLVKPYETRICQRRDYPPRKAEKSYREEIRQLIESVGYNAIDSYHYLAISSKKLAEFLESNCGSGSHNKRIPKFIFSLNPHLRKLFFSTLMKGDGTAKRLRYTTVSKKLAEDVLILGLLNGMRGRIRTENQNIFRVDFRVLPTSLKPFKHVKEIQKEADVYCLIAKRNHIIYAGRNGKLNWIGQCFGPREAQPYIIPEIIRQFNIGNELHLGNVDAKRDFLWVYDHCDAVVKLMEVPDLEGTIVNCGRGKNWSIKEIVDKLAKIMNKEPYTIVQERKRLRPFDVDELLCDNTLFNQLTGGIKYTDFEDGLKWLVDWYHRHGDKWSWEREKEMSIEALPKKK